MGTNIATTPMTMNIAQTPARRYLVLETPATSARAKSEKSKALAEAGSPAAVEGRPELSGIGPATGSGRLSASNTIRTHHAGGRGGAICPPNQACCQRGI